MRPGRNAPSSLEDASAHLQRSMGSARRGGESLFELRTSERAILRNWCQAHGCVFTEDPTLNLDGRRSHGEHSVAFDPANAIWWKTTHPGKAGVGAEFHYEAVPPFRITNVSARELLPSEYLSRMLLHNREFGDDVRFEGYLDAEQPSLIVSQPDIEGEPATAEDMIGQMLQFGYLSLGMLEIGKAGSISFYHPDRHIAVFDAHPGNFFRAGDITIPIDGIIAEIGSEAEHQWLLDRATS